MKLSTAIKVLDSQAAWLGLTGTQLLEDIARHGRILYSERVVEAYSVYDLHQRVSKDLQAQGYRV